VGEAIMTVAPWPSDRRGGKPGLARSSCNSFPETGLDELPVKAFFWAVVSGLLALVAPCIALVFNRWAAAAAGVLTLTATILYSISTRHIPSNVNIRVDVAIMYPLLLVAWLECIGLTGFAVVKKPRKT
jgi:hypothetical protein